MPTQRSYLHWLPLLACLVCAMVMAHAAQLPDLAWTERSDWINVKTDVVPAAVGDGIADDTAAIQAAFNTAGNGVTIYFPPGTYKVTSTVTLNGGTSHFGVNLIGHGRSTTIAWYGVVGGNVITINGNGYGRYVGLIVDGRGIAASGFYHYNTIGMFETSIRYKHVGLYNLTGNAIYAVTGDASAVAETSYENCIFDHCGVGMMMGGFNDYNHTFMGCDFIACGTGIYANHGSFNARDCFFSGSTTADIQAYPEHGCSVRRCKSTDSVKFITFSNSVSPLVVQDCYVTNWTGTGGAITQGSSTMLLSHSRFVNPPDTNAPVRCSGKLVACDNAAPQSTVVATASQIYTVPAGAYPPRVGSTDGANITSFVNQTVAVPPTIYDAVADFGAVGNGVADDTTAIQNTIDAARTAGGGAIAYLPRGNYKITSMLTVTGSNYVIGGCGYFARIIWGGAVGGTMMRVTDPNNVRLENILVGHTENGVQNNGIDIEQTTVLGPSLMTYEGVYVYGKYQKQPENKGLYLNHLGSNCTVIMDLLEGNIRLNDCGDATILGNLTYEGAITIDDTSSTRSGFFGIMARLSTLNVYGVYVRNNNNFVMTDWYAESCDNGTSLSGVEGDPEGRITIQGSVSDFAGSANAQFLTINDYQGHVFFGSNQLYCNPPVQTLTQTGTRPLNIVLYAGLYYNDSLSTSLTSAVLETLGNRAAGSGVAPADNYTAQTLTDMSAAFDDFQRMGSLDLDLNYTFLQANTPPTVSITSPANNAVILGTSLTITADASDADGTISKVEFYQGVTKIGEDTVAPYTCDWTGIVGNAYTLTAKAIDDDLAVTTSDPVNITVWNTQDIGAVGLAGSAGYASPTFTVTGAGAGIAGTADAFRFVYRQISGDCTITARVATFTSSITNARAGVMIRQSLDANSKEASSLFKPRSTIRVYFHRRTTTGGSTTTSYGSATAAPYWVRVVRTGSTLKAYKSANGTTWTQVGSNVTISMTDPIYIGLAVTSGTTTATRTATFDNVTITQP